MKDHIMRIGQAIARRRIARRDERILLKLDPHILRDIGLEPGHPRIQHRTH